MTPSSSWTMTTVDSDAHRVRWSALKRRFGMPEPMRLALRAQVLARAEQIHSQHTAVRPDVFDIEEAEIAVRQGVVAK